MKQIRWAVAGVGDIATKRVIPAILDEPRSVLAGVVTSDPRKAERYRVPAWDSLAGALPNADAVYLATPVYLHARETIQALGAGKHVLCEKPMAMDYAEALTMQTAAEAAGRVLGIAYYRRTYPKVHRAKALIEAGAIGAPVLAELTCHDWVESGWRTDPALAGGGPLYDIASHRIDLLNFLFGTPLRAVGFTGNAVHRYATEDNATVLVDYAGGVRGIVDVRWHSRVYRDECRIRGTNGELDLSPLNSARLITPSGEESHPTHANLHYPCIEDFVDAVLSGRPPLSSGVTALETSRVTAEVLESKANSETRR